MSEWRSLGSAVGAVLLAASALSPRASGATVGDLATVRGIRSNHLVGLGLVVGLKGTGDRSAATREAVRRLGASCGFVSTEADAPNSALVVVTAELGPFLHEGARIDVGVAAQGDAESLAGGTLVATPLWAGSPDAVYVRAQGAVGASEAQGRAAAGIVTRGGIVEREPAAGLMAEFADALAEGRVVLDMKRPSPQAAAAVADAVRRAFGPGDARVGAKATSPGAVALTFGPAAREDAVRFLADVLACPVEYIPPARIVVNERTGTVAASGRLEIAPAAVTAGDLSVTIGPRPQAPATGSGADGGKPLVAARPGMTLQELVQELNRIQVSPGDVIAVLKGLVDVGAVNADVIVE